MRTAENDSENFVSFNSVSVTRVRRLASSVFDAS